MTSLDLCAKQQFLSAILLTLLASNGGCGGSSNEGNSSASGGGTGAGGPTTAINSSATGGALGSGIQATGIDLGIGGTSGENGTSTLVAWPPAGYINVTDTTVGAYALGPDISNNNVPAPGVCAGLFGVVRDFKMGTQPDGHPDFETAPTRDVKGIVLDTLGPDGKPVFAAPDGTTTGISGQESFDQWYRDVPGVNMTYLIGFKLVTEGNISTFSALKANGVGMPESSFFPLDGQGFGNEEQPHNFSFTTEIHTSFAYKGGETFTFKGDDDVWVFINKQLVIDLGGRHAQETGSISVDTLGLTVGSTYDLAVFHAERHTSESNFQIQTTLDFADCGQVNGVILQ
jgi:fibro-slime domain-containing protein